MATTFDSTTFLERVCSALRNAGVPYAIAGGHAVSLHGAVRGTIDVDLVLDWMRQTLEDAEATLNELGLVSRLPLTAGDVFEHRDEYIRNRNLIAWNFHNPDNPAEQVDILINHDLREATAAEVKLPGGPISVLGLDDLIAMKRASGRDQDLADICALECLR